MIAAASRSLAPEVRNPVLALPAFQQVRALAPGGKETLRRLLLDIAADARARAEKCWRAHKAPMALYWKCVGVYTGHIARAIGKPSTIELNSKRARGIVVGKSWPRAASPCDLVPLWEGEFHSFNDWINFASKRLTVAEDSNGHPLSAICVDRFGRRCANGRDFARARDDDAFPVRYFWDCVEPSQ